MDTYAKNVVMQIVIVINVKNANNIAHCLISSYMISLFQWNLNYSGIMIKFVRQYCPVLINAIKPPNMYVVR